MRSAVGVFERPTLIVRPMSTSTSVFWCSSHKVYQPVCLQARSNLLLYIPVCLLIGRDNYPNGARNFMSAGIGKRRHLTEAGFVVMWSSGFIGASLGTPEAGTPTLMVWRFLLAAGLLLVGILLLRRRWPGLREIAVQGVVGLLAQGVYLTGVVGAVEVGVTAGTTALIAALQPLLAAGLAGPVFGEHVSRQQWAGLAVGLVGVTLVVGGDAGVGGDAPLWAYAMPFVGMAGLVAATLVERKE